MSTARAKGRTASTHVSASCQTDICCGAKAQVLRPHALNVADCNGLAAATACIGAELTACICGTDLLSTSSADNRAAFGSYSEMPMAGGDDDDDVFDGFVSSANNNSASTNAAAGHARATPLAAACSALRDQGPADRTEAVLSSLPDMSFMLDRGRYWPVRRGTVASHG